MKPKILSDELVSSLCSMLQKVDAVSIVKINDMILIGRPIKCDVRIEPEYTDLHTSPSHRALIGDKTTGECEFDITEII